MALTLTRGGPPVSLRRGSRRGGRSQSGAVVGLDVQPGEIVAAEVQGGAYVSVQRAVVAPLEPGVVREGEVSEVDALAAALKRLFAEHKLPSRVRVGLASQRAVMRTIDLPPLQDAKDIEAAIRLQAADHIAMPLAHAVVDHHVVGIVQTEAGPRTRVVVTAAQRDSVDRLLAALRGAGLRPTGIDLSAFALVRGLHHGEVGDGPVLYAQVSGVTTLAIARGTTCELTRVAPTGLEELASRLAEREGIVLGAARDRLVDYDPDADDSAALAVLDHGLAELADDLRNTIEFHAGQVDGDPVASVVLSGPAAAIPNFCEVLEQRIGLPVALGQPAEARPGAFDGLAPTRAAVAAGLAVEELVA
jgi:type IV pilus assembly protein PilM